MGYTNFPWVRVPCSGFISHTFDRCMYVLLFGLVFQNL